jgi:D-lactate dehydrogenase
MPMLDVFLYEAFEEEIEELHQAIPAHIRAEYTWKTIQEAEDLTPPAKLISIRTQSILPMKWIDSLSGILTRSTGYDHIHAYFRKCEKSVPCGYLPLYCNRSVAEQAMLLWMALLRRLSQQQQQFNNFGRDGITGWESQGKILVVFGVGNIGSEIVKIGMGMDMEVYGVDLVKKYDFVHYISKNEGIRKADIVVCAMNLTHENTDYFNYNFLKKAKPGLLFINIARGEMSSSSVLLKLLREKHLGGCGLDVYDHERDLAVSLRAKKISLDSEVRAALQMKKRSDVILTPHNAFNTREAVDRKAKHSAQQVEHFLKDGSFLWSVPELIGYANK